MSRRLLVTGLHGTVGPRVADLARSQGYDIIPWPRKVVDPEDLYESNMFLSRMDLCGIVHLAYGSERWAGLLSHFAGINSIPMVFTSTAMVYSNRRNGPYVISDVTDSNESYGQYKIRCEQAVRNASMKSCVLRLGWQIGEDGQGNNMVHHLDQEQEKNGRVTCSELWIPACAYLEDTAGVIMRCINERWYGLFHVDSNAEDAYSYARIVALLKEKLGRNWRIHIDNTYIHDQRLKDSYLPVPRLSARLPDLRRHV